MRSNTMSVLRQLSLASEKDFKRQQNILELKTIRSAHGSTQGREIGKESEGFKLAGALFYYLFEDYTAAVPILFKSRDVIHELQQAIMEIDQHKIKIRPRSKNIIPLLHDLGKQLRQVKHLFHSYQTIVGQILNSRGPAGSSLGALGSACHLDETPLWFSHSAGKRFERLDYHLQLMMLNHLEEALEETRALSETVSITLVNLTGSGMNQTSPD